MTVPIARSGVLAGAALVFLSAMKELPATLLLRPIGFDTLATEIWSLTQIGAYGRAAVPSLVLIAVSAPVLWLLSPARRNDGCGGVDSCTWRARTGTRSTTTSRSIYFLAFPIGEYRPASGSSAIAARVAEMLGVSRASAGEMLKRLEADGLVERGAHKEAILTPTGVQRAERVVRKHRIIERFLTDFMGYTASESHVQADLMGDTFTDEMIERINERLGHPDRCPHGWPVEPDVEHGRTPGSSRSPSSSRASPARSCASPSTTATSCTGSTRRGSRPAPWWSCGRRSRPRAS